jgi:Uma2 family endonuclease
LERIAVPLTPQDILHPEEEDVISVSTQHDKACRYLADTLFLSCRNDSTKLVLSDTMVYWDDPLYPNHSPDIAYIPNVRQQRDNWRSFHVVEQGTRPSLIIEVVSENCRDNDIVIKPIHYHHLGIETYVTADLVEGQWTTTGYRMARGSYQVMNKDDRGRLWLASIGMWLGIADGNLTLYDGETDEPYPYHADLFEREKAMCQLANEEGRRAAEAHQRAVDAHQRAVEACALAELERQRAEQSERRAEQLERRAEEERQRTKEAERRAASFESEIIRLRALIRDQSTRVTPTNDSNSQ